MKSSDRAILIGLAVVGLIAGFWFLVLSPKRAEVSDLDAKITQLESTVSQQEQLAAFAESAKDGYSENYHRTVVLGKATPSSEDTSSLFLQIDEIAKQADVGFQAIALDTSGGAVQPTAPAQETTADAPVEGQVASESTPTAAVAPTESTAAALPIGATVGPGGLAVMPYNVQLTGDFFQMADFLAGLDKLVGSDGRIEGVNGRLLTIDGFSLGGDEEQGFEVLDADLLVTAYVAPSASADSAAATPVATPTATPIAPEASTTSTTTPTTPAP